ncbi:MAG TPA: replicative DNA helicase [Micromonosporaceae bacterium]
MAAEQCVLGAMMLSKDAIADVIEVLRSADFYRPAHATIFDTILDLYGRGEPADPITVVGALTNSGELVRVGGAAYLHTLISLVPTAANAGYYARIVAERAVLRRLVEAGTRIVAMGYGAASGQGKDVDDIVDLAQQAVYDVTERRTGDDFTILADLLQPALDEIESVGSREGVMAGVPTGFGDLDRLLGGLHPGQLIVVAGRPGLGKALALDTLLPTPDGWTTMGEVRVGDRLLDAAGRPTTVIACSDVMAQRPCYEVEFCDGSVIVADAGHRWVTRSRRERRRGRPGAVRTTAELLVTLRPRGSGHLTARAQRANHSVATTAPLRLPFADLLLEPYVLGTWLAGSDEPVRGSYGLLRALGVLAERHVPMAYLRAAEGQRRDLLAGMLDVAGTVTADGRVRLRVRSQRLARDVSELVAGLGYRCAATREAAPVLTFATADDVFQLEEKVLVHKRRRRLVSPREIGLRYVVDVRPVASVPVRCVSVDNDEQLFLAGRAMVPTHNSTVSMDFARTASVRHNHASAIFSLEMSKIEIVTRLLAAEARVPLQVLRSGQLSDEDWTRLARRMGEINEAPIFVDDTPNMTLMEIRAKARRLRQRHDLKLVVVDYLQLMTSPKRVENRQQEVAELSRGLKLLAKEIECPVIAVSQLNRGPEQRTDKRPQLSDLRESGCLAAGTRVVRADTNQETTLGELLASRSRDIPVWTLDEKLKYVPATMTHVFSTGTRPTFRLRLRSGRDVEATSNHRFLTVDGWMPLGELVPGARVAVPRHVPAPLSPAPWSAHRVVLLAHLLGDGSFVRRQPIRYASTDEANLAAVSQSAAAEFGISAVRDQYEAARVTTLRLPAPFRLARGRRNPVAQWLDELGLFGVRSHERFIPDPVFCLPKAQVALFLRHLWATGGTVGPVRGSRREGRICYTSPSRALLDGVRQLLLRFGISARLANRSLEIGDRDDQLRFLREIGVHGGRSAGCAALLAALEGAPGNPTIDTVPDDLWTRVRTALVERGLSHRELAAALGRPVHGAAPGMDAPARSRLGRVAAILDTAQLDLHATNDVFWDEVEAIEPLGEQEVFDATVLGWHNFIANGIVAHNSIEQDADVVILLHRDDYYDRESPRAGEADFIVAKHRNGPTDTVTVAAQLHFSRFVDMAV